MDIFDHMEEHGHEQVIFNYDKRTGLKAIIAIHDSTLGPALGGIRFKPYEAESDAVTDALRLSEGMTYKFAAAGINFGGGKAVVIDHEKITEREQMFQALGRFVETLHGRFATGEDVGTTPEDMVAVRTKTQHVQGLPKALGGAGDPAPITALGVLHGITACLAETFGEPSPSNRKIAIQGIGSVGYHLAKYLRDAGATLIVADVDERKTEQAKQEFDAQAVSPDQIYSVDCDVFSPCAFGAVLNDETIPQLKCKIVAGAANNQLAESRHGAMLQDRNILYAPDFVINAGGAIYLTHTIRDISLADAMKQTEGIYNTITTIIGISKREHIPTSDAAIELAKRKLQELGDPKQIYVGTGKV